MNDDLKLDDDNDLYIDPATGDFVIENVIWQTAKNLLESSKNDWKQSPTTGLNIERYTNASGNHKNMERDIFIEYTNDGFTDIKLNVDQFYNIKFEDFKRLK